MDGSKKQADKLNIVWIFAFTIMGGAFVYASFVFLQALFLDDAESVRFKREAEGKRAAFNALRAKQVVTDYKKVTEKDGTTRIQIPLNRAMELVVNDVRKGNPSNLVMAVGPSDQPTVPAVFGRPPDNVQMPAPDPPAPPTPTPTPGGDGTVEAPPEGPEGPAAGAAPTPGATPAPAAGAAPAPAQPKPAAAQPKPAAQPRPAQPAGGNANP